MGSLNQHPTQLPLRSPPSSESETGRDAVILMFVGSKLNTLRPPGKKMALGRQQRGETAFPNPWHSWLPGRYGVRRTWALWGLLPLPGLVRSPEAMAAGPSLGAAASGRREEGRGRRRPHPAICHRGRGKIYLTLLWSESPAAGRKREGEGL